MVSEVLDSLLASAPTLAQPQERTRPAMRALCFMLDQEVNPPPLFGRPHYSPPLFAFSDKPNDISNVRFIHSLPSFDNFLQLLVNIAGPSFELPIVKQCHCAKLP